MSEREGPARDSLGPVAQGTALCRFEGLSASGVRGHIVREPEERARYRGMPHPRWARHQARRDARRPDRRPRRARSSGTWSASMRNGVLAITRDGKRGACSTTSRLRGASASMPSASRPRRALRRGAASSTRRSCRVLGTRVRARTILPNRAELRPEADRQRDRLHAVARFATTTARSSARRCSSRT